MDDLPDDPQALFEMGLALFNDGEYFHAHEVWEELWHLETGPEKLFAQGLVQFAVVLVHHERGNARGVRAVTKTAKARLSAACPTYRGLDRLTVLNLLDHTTRATLALDDAAFTSALKHPAGSLPAFEKPVLTPT